MATTRDEPRGVEDALFEVELPGAGLLRQEPALQPVGEPGDDALQMRQLLVEQVAQPAQLVGIAQFVGLDDLVGRGAEGAVDARSRRPGRAACWPGRPGRPGSSSLAPGIISPSASASPSSSASLVGAVGGRAVHRRLRAGGGAFAASLWFSPSASSPWLCVVVADESSSLAEIEIEVLDQPAGGAGIGVLVEDRAVEFGEVAGDLAFEPRPPQIDDAPGRGRRRLVGQRLAGQQAHRLGHRAFGALGDALEALAAILLVEHRGRGWWRPRPCAARPAPRPAPARPPRTPLRASGPPGSRFECTASS